jgi:hypothetical protein
MTDKKTPMFIEMAVKECDFHEYRGFGKAKYILETMYMSGETQLDIVAEVEHMLRLHEMTGMNGIKHQVAAVREIEDMNERLVAAYYIHFNLEGLKTDHTLESLFTQRTTKYP